MEALLILALVLLSFLSGWVFRGKLNRMEVYRNQVIGQLVLRAELSLNDIYRRRFLQWVEDPQTKLWAHEVQKKYGAVRIHTRGTNNGP